MECKFAMHQRLGTEGDELDPEVDFHRNIVLQFKSRRLMGRDR